MSALSPLQSISPKPAIVLVHGSFHSPAHFDRFSTALTAEGYKTIPVSLPSMHYTSLQRPPPVGLSDDIEAVRSAILTELYASPNNDVVVLVHSSGGRSGSPAIQSLDKPSRLASGKFTNGVTHLLVISGYLIPAGITTLSWLGNQTPLTMSLSKARVPSSLSTTGVEEEIEVSVPSDPAALYYYDIPAADAAHYASLLVPQVWSVMLGTMPFAGYCVVPVHYLICERDRALPPDVQNKIINDANRDIERNAPDSHKISVESIDCGHSPFLNRVEDTVDWLKRCLAS